MSAVAAQATRSAKFITYQMKFASQRFDARLFFEVFLALTKTILIPIQRCSVCPEMSNKIALLSLDFAATGSMCAANKRSWRPWTRS